MWTLLGEEQRVLGVQCCLMGSEGKFEDRGWLYLEQAGKDGSDGDM